MWKIYVIIGTLSSFVIGNKWITVVVLLSVFFVIMFNVNKENKP